MTPSDVVYGAMSTSKRSELTRHGKQVESVFDLLGRQENDLTAALGFTLSRSSHLLERLLNRIGYTGNGPAILRLETRDGAGRTDLEIESPGFLVVIEAKRGWHLPEKWQLEQYVGRVRTWGAGTLVTLSDCSTAFAILQLPQSLEGVQVIHLPWSDVKADIEQAARVAGLAERHWLGELRDYLRRTVEVTDPSSGWTYCVSLSVRKPGGGGKQRFIDFVVDDGVYFHPYGWGSGWPSDPPNFFAFRWGGHVRQIRRAMSHEVVPNLQQFWPDIPLDEDTTRPHVVHRLGPELPMEGPLPAGANYRASRLWVLVDQLLVSETLKDAIATSKALTGG
ncbi:MAG: hypothetical protein ACLP5O_18440 [Acidimicrobiales bacterium]